MSKAPEPGICERLTRRHICRASHQTTVHHIVNPDGPEAAALIRDLAIALRELVAIVRGECPSLLDEDSGGSAALDIQIDELLSRAGANR